MVWYSVVFIIGGSSSCSSSKTRVSEYSKTVLKSEYEGTGEGMNCECANKDTLGFWNIPDGAKMTLVIKLRGC